MVLRLGEIVGVQPGFKAAVDILQDLENQEKIKAYIPTENGVRTIEQVFEHLKPHSASRSIMLTGTYGTGKSHLGLVIATLLRKGVEEPLFKSILRKLRSKWPSVADKIEKAKRTYGAQPYLLVYLEAERIDWSPGFFDSSLNLVLKEALKREHLEHITPRTAYDRAVQRIGEIETQFPDAFNRLRIESAKEGYTSVDLLKHKLGRHDRSALKDFADIHRKVCAGADFDWFSGLSSSDAFLATAEALQSEGYKGILLVWDEFTPVLRKLIRNPDSGEALSFQKFAQTCEGSGVYKIVSLLISIRNIPEMIDRVSVESLGGESVRKEAEKISGRFKTMRLGHIDRETYYLIKGIIFHRDTLGTMFKKHNERFLELADQIEMLELFSDYGLSAQDKSVIINDLYPLHPLTTLAVSRLTDRVGQRERTIFTFLCDTGQGTFADLLGKKAISETQLPFVYPFELEPYFFPLITQCQDYKELRKLARKFRDLMTILSQEDETSRRIVKTVFILTASGIPSSTEHLFLALGSFTQRDKKEVENKLELLRQGRRITQRLSDKSWRFYGTTEDTAMDDHIKEMIQEVARRYPLKELLNAALSTTGVKEVLRTIKAEDYNIDRNLKRKLCLEFITSRELDNPDDLRTRVEQDYRDGAYYLVLGDTDEEVSVATRQVVTSFSEDTNVLFAFPLSVTHFREISPALRRLKALELLPNRYPQYGSEWREEVILEKEDANRFLREKLDELLDPSKGHVAFYYKGEKREVRAVNKLRQLVSQMMEMSFPYTPAIARDELINEAGNDTWRSRYRIPLINVVLSPRGPSLLSQETDKVKKHIIDAVYKHHNVLRHDRGQWVVGKPQSSPQNDAMVRLWDEIDEFLRKATTYREFSHLIRILRLRPYGLKQRTIGLILAAVIREYVLHNNLVVHWKGQPLPKIDGELLEEKIVTRSQQIGVKFQEITEKHRAIWSAVAKTYGSVEADLESAHRAVVNWWRGLPQYSRITAKISQRGANLKESFLQPLSAQEKDKAEIFGTVLPGLVGIEDLGTTDVSDIKQTTARVLTEIKKEFERCISRLHEDVKQAILDVFGGEDILTKYWSRLPEQARSHVFAGDAKTLVDWLRETAMKQGINLGSFVELAEEISGKCDNWTDDQIVNFKGHLESAKGQIEGYFGPPPTGEGIGVPPISVPEGKVLLKLGDVGRQFTLYERLEDSPNSDQVRILFGVLKDHLFPALRDGQITADELLSIFYHLIRESDIA